MYYPETSIPVTLEWYELQLCCTIGSQRQIEAFRKNLAPKLGYWSWHSHIEGAAGELAVAKALNMYWSGSVNTFGQADIGADIQVRLRKSTSDFEPCLIVRPEDDDAHLFVLVIGESPYFHVIGWLYGHECKKAEYFKTYGQKRPAYFVPIPQLRDIHDLTEEPA